MYYNRQGAALVSTDLSIGAACAPLADCSYKLLLQAMLNCYYWRIVIVYVFSVFIVSFLARAEVCADLCCAQQLVLLVLLLLQLC
jgi:hypothetical protein